MNKKQVKIFTKIIQHFDLPIMWAFQEFVGKSNNRKYKSLDGFTCDNKDYFPILKKNNTEYYFSHSDTNCYDIYYYNYSKQIHAAFSLEINKYNVLASKFSFLHNSNKSLGSDSVDWDNFDFNYHGCFELNEQRNHFWKGDNLL